MHCCFVQQSSLRFSAFLRPFSARFIHPTKRCYHFGVTTILRYPTTIRYYHRLLGLRSLSSSSVLLPVRMDGGANVRSVATTVPNHTRFRDKTFKENIHKLRSQFQKRKQQFHDNVMTIPNALCILRIGLTPLIGYLVVEQCFVSALGVFTIAGATDLLDGYIARHMKGQSSLLGSMLDPIADKLLVSTLFITLTYVNLIPLLLTTVVIMRDICLITGGFIKRYRLLLPPITFQRYFDPSVSPIKVAPTIMSKINTALQLSLVAGALASPVFHFVGHPYFTVLCFATGATTVISGLQYAMVDRMKRVRKR